MENRQLLHKHRWAIKLIGVILFIIVLTRIRVRDVIDIISEADPLYVFFAVLLILPFVGFKALRWKFLLKDLKIDLSLKNSFLIYMIGLFLGYITPGQLGEGGKAVYLHGMGHSLGRSLISIFWDRLFDVLLLCIVAMPGFFIFRNFFRGHVNLSIILGTFLILLVIFLATAKRWVGWFERLVRSHILKKLPESEAAACNPNIATLLSVRQFHLLPVITTTCGAYLVHFLRFYLLLLSLHVGMPFIYFTVGMAVVSLVSLLPITFVGIGIREIALIAMFSTIGLSNELAISFSMLILVTYICNGVMGFFVWLGFPLLGKQVKSDKNGSV